MVMRNDQKRRPSLSLQVLGVCFLSFALSFQARAEDPPSTGTLTPTYIPGGLNSNTLKEAQSAQEAAALKAAGTATSLIGTPDASIPNAPGAAAGVVITGQFRKADGSVLLEKQYLARYKESVVRVVARDNSGNELGRTMGTAIGRPGGKVFIASPLSGVLGNSMQWADTIEIVNHAGNRNKANVALVNEQLDLVLLDPLNKPAPINFVRPSDERAQIDIFTISFDDDTVNVGRIKPNIHNGMLQAINVQEGTLTVSSNYVVENSAGTAIISKTNELMGMLLPNGQGVLASALNNAISLAEKAEPISPRLVGVVMGRGVLVDEKLPFAFPTITAALEAIKEGKAPKTNPALYIPAKTRDLSPREAERIVLKVMPGVYNKEKQPINIGGNVSLTGSGAALTTIVGTDPAKPLFSIQNQANISVTGFRLVPAALQNGESSTVEIRNSSAVIVLGNIVEAKGGSGILLDGSSSIALFGNTFPRGKLKAVQCRASSMVVEGNAFLGDWPQAITVDSGCASQVRRNLFIETQIGLATSSQAREMEVKNNNFIKSLAGVRFFGEVPSGVFTDNIFFQNAFAFYGSKDYTGKRIGRNALWKSQVSFKGKPFKSLDMEIVQPIFEAPENYDFRLRASSSLVNSATTSGEDGRLDIGAFQRTDCAGRFTPQLLQTIAAAVGEKKLATGCPNK